jgi:hypothetical protein
MHDRRRTGALSAAVMTLAAVAACSAPDSEPTSNGSTAAPGTYGSPVNSSQADPTDVATDAPVTAEPGPSLPLVVTFADWDAAAGVVEAAGYVSGVAESGGTCTLTLTRGGSSVTATSAAEPDRSATSCFGLTVPGDRLGSGTWSAVLSYESPASQAESSATEVQVP